MEQTSGTFVLLLATKQVSQKTLFDYLIQKIDTLSTSQNTEKNVSKPILTFILNHVLRKSFCTKNLTQYYETHLSRIT